MLLSAAIDTPTLVEVLVVSGVFSGIAGTVQWFFTGRGRARVDNAKIVQGMAIDLIEPLHSEVADLRGQMGALRLELEQVLAYAILAHELLIGNPAAPVPPPSVLRKTGT